jgi:hypothetical protein
MKSRWQKRCYSHGGRGRDFKIAAFDLETDGLGGKVLFATALMEGGTDVVCFRGRDCVADLFNYMCDYTDFIWFAHNAQYDWRYILNYLHDLSFTMRFSLRNDNSLYAITVILDDGKTLRMRDSYALFNQPLRGLAATFCPELPKGDIDFDRETFDPNKRSHVDYAKRDVEILVRGLRRFSDIVRERYDVNLASTFASTAMRAWERMLDKETRYFNPVKHETFIRSGYFGGLVFLTRNDAVKGAKTYDINSSYPYQMRKHGVPYGRIWTVRTFYDDRPGIYDVTIGTPDNLRVPIIPKRSIRGVTQSILWPRGVFRTTITSLELSFAIKHGYRLFEVHSGRVFEQIIHPFDDFVNLAETVRAHFKGTAAEVVAKFIQNSLYGKLAARRERRGLYHERDIEDFTGCEAWDDGGRYWVKREYADDMMVLPLWAVWITANARLHLLRAVYEELGPDKVIYGDTDSITCVGDLPTGKAYGDWKLEKSWEEFRAIAPKVYAGRLVSGQWAGACKGLPTRSSAEENRIFSELFHRGQSNAVIQSLPSLLVTMRGKSGSLRVMNRKSTDIANSNSWELGEPGEIRPRRITG